MPASTRSRRLVCVLLTELILPGPRGGPLARRRPTLRLSGRAYGAGSDRSTAPCVHVPSREVAAATAPVLLHRDLPSRDDLLQRVDAEAEVFSGAAHVEPSGRGGRRRREVWCERGGQVGECFGVAGELGE